MNSKKIIACIMTAGMVATSIGTTSAYAIGLPCAPTSSFRYELVATPVSTNESKIDRVKVTFQITNNPGFSHLGIAFMYDEENCPIVMREFSSEVYENNYFVYQHPEENLDDMVFIDFAPAINTTGEVYDCFSVSMIFDVDEENADWYEFSFAVVGYTSEEEGISYNNLTSGQQVAPETSIQACPYVIGDVNDNGLIEVSDASAVLSICSSYGDTSTNRSISVAALNAIISSGQFVNNESLSRMRCAEVADADKNGAVQVADGEEILTYYSNSSANLPMETLVGNAEVKTVII